MAQGAEKLIENFSEDSVVEFFRSISDNFRLEVEDESHLFTDDQKEAFNDLHSLGSIKFDNYEKVIVCRSQIKDGLTERTSKLRQYALARTVLKDKKADGGLFLFHDKKGCFRFSFVRVFHTGAKRQFSTYKRYSFFVDPKLPNKTFRQQIEKAKFSSLDNIQETFSIESVTKAFYNEFKPKFEELANSVQGLENKEAKEDFALLFVIRVIFLGFVQKKGWLEKKDFLEAFWREYSKTKVQEKFYSQWLRPLFFDALNSSPGHKVKYQNNPFSKETEAILQMAPYLNGELFKRHNKIDKDSAFIPDKFIADFLSFLFQYNFTIEENTNIDEELELSPEFLGIIFERLVNKEDGAVYTPRTEVDFMCRLSLVKWLEKNTACNKTDLFHLFFREGGHDDCYDEHQKYGDFTTVQIRELHEKLGAITVCDPAAGSGAFEVGMMQVLNEALENLQGRQNAPKDIQKITSFERKKRIIANSLYGVEVKHWAVWINQLRLWLSLFIDMPDDEKNSQLPLLPSLNFKIRCGDSLVQRIGGKIFPVQGHAALKPSLKGEVTKLKALKTDFYNNKGVKELEVRSKEYMVFKSILEDQLEEVKTKMRVLTSGEKIAQGDMFGGIKPIQPDLDFGKAEKDKLASEIEELEEELKALKLDHPFIWSIEFAEVFYERGGFDIIIGNPPYISKDNVFDPCGYINDPKAYKDLLKEVIHLDFPFHFTKSNQINGRSDLYIYFYIHTLNLLNQNGFHCFICSNSWLDVGFGAWLQEFLLKHVRMHYIIDNHAQRSFASADVNTIITLFEAPQKKSVWSESLLRFVAFKRPFEESLITENLLNIEEISSIDISEVRQVYPVSHDELWKEGLEKEGDFYGEYVGEKWGGKYLRAPEIYFKLLKKGKYFFQKIGEVAEVNEGRPTGANDYFFPEKHIAEEYKIESDYLCNGLMKTKGKSYEVIKEEHIKRNFLLLPEVENWQDKRVNDYFLYGEQEIVPKSKTLKQKNKWWYFKDRVAADLLAPCGVGDKFFCAVNEAKAITSNSYTEIRLTDKTYMQKIHRSLNHPIGWLQMELAGRHALGGGMLKTDPIEFRRIFFLNAPLETKYLERKIRSVFEESGIDPESPIPIEEQEPNPLSDRQDSDNAVFDILNFTSEERKLVYRAVCRLVWNRISKAKSV